MRDFHTGRDADPSITLGVTLGSAIFNQLTIVGACALVAPGGALRVQWRAMLRDVLVWGATIVITAGCLANGKVSALEGWLMVAFYALYVESKTGTKDAMGKPYEAMCDTKIFGTSC